MSQTRKGSLIEVLINVAVGYFIAVAAQVMILPWFGINITLSLNILIGLCFTVVSIARGYALRRAFNWLAHITGTRFGQSRRASLSEAVVNVLIGYFVSIFSQAIIFPLFGIYVSMADNLLIGLAFTLVSVMRSYVLRRVFNHLIIRRLAQPA